MDTAQPSPDDLSTPLEFESGVLSDVRLGGLGNHRGFLGMRNSAQQCNSLRNSAKVRVSLRMNATSLRETEKIAYCCIKPAGKMCVVGLRGQAA